MCYIRVMEENGFKQPAGDMHSVPVFSDDLMRSVMDAGTELNSELVGTAAVAGKPMQTLQACLGSFTREHLRELAKDHDLYLSSAVHKKELVDSLAGRLIDRFPKMLPYLPVVNLEFLARFKGVPRLTVARDALQFRDISHTQNFGFLYVFRTGDTYTAVVPRELLPALDVLGKENLWREAGFHQRMDAYAVALSNLYGVLDIDQYAVVWNRYESETMTPAMVEDELAELGRVQYYWWFEEELVISSFFRSTEEVEEFLMHVKEIPYYIPSREDLVHYYQTPYDDNSPAVSAMMEFLSAYRLSEGGQVEDLMDEIADACIVGNGMQDVFDLLNEYGLLFTGMDEITRFTELYTQLSEHSRKWELRGHTPSALKKQSRSG